MYIDTGEHNGTKISVGKRLDNTNCDGGSSNPFSVHLKKAGDWSMTLELVPMLIRPMATGCHGYSTTSIAAPLQFAAYLRRRLRDYKTEQDTDLFSPPQESFKLSADGGLVYTSEMSLIPNTPSRDISIVIPPSELSSLEETFSAENPPSPDLCSSSKLAQSRPSFFKSRPVGNICFAKYIAKPEPKTPLRDEEPTDH